MAKETIIRVTDDLDGSEAVGTVVFGWEGRTYEIDLSKKNASAFTKAVKPYVDAARPVRGSASRSARRASSKSVTKTAATDLAAIRHWARESGYQVSDRGRISKEVVEAYNSSR